MNLKISIITVCYNSSEYIRTAIESVLSQTYPHIEYIIIDGGSCDGTLEIISEYTNKIAQIVSEPDRGIYDAMNKGLSLATGDVVGILNSDDYYDSTEVISSLARNFDDLAVDACYGDLVYVEQSNANRIVRYWKSCDFKSGLFKKAWVPAHPTFFARREVYEKFGLFDLNYKLAADMELLFRLIEINKINTVYIPSILVKMRLGGATNQNFSNVIKQNKEILSVLDLYYGKVNRSRFFFGKLVDRIRQYFSKPVSD